MSRAAEIINTVTAVAEDEDEEETKTGADRPVPLNIHIRADLREWWLYLPPTERRARVSENTERGGMTPGQFSNGRRAIWVPTLASLKLGLDAKAGRHVPPKHLRHSCVSMWIREGKDVGTVADMAGHSPEICWKHYRLAFKTLDPDDHFEIVSAIAAARSLYEESAKAAIGGLAPDAPDRR